MKMPFQSRFLKSTFCEWMAKKSLWLLPGVVVVAGCSGVETFKRESAPEYVTVKAADFFVHGPMQPGRPVELPAQEFVKVLGKDSGYSVVLLGDGRRGWVDSECLRPAPPSGRAATEAEVFPEKALPPLPEPDLKLPVEDVPQKGSPLPSPEKNL